MLVSTVIGHGTWFFTKPTAPIFIMLPHSPSLSLHMVILYTHIGEDINVAINLIPPNKLNLFKLLVSKYPVEQGEADTMIAFCDSAKKLNKPSFLEALKNNMMVKQWVG